MMTKGLAFSGNVANMEGMKLITKALRLAKPLGITQRAMADAMGVAESRISEWKEREEAIAAGKLVVGQRLGGPNVQQAFDLARLLRVPLDFLADDHADDPPLGMPKEEQDVLAMVRRLRLDGDEALRRVSSADVLSGEERRILHHYRDLKLRGIMEEKEAINALYKASRVPKAQEQEERLEPDEKPVQKRSVSPHKAVRRVIRNPSPKHTKSNDD